MRSKLTDNAASLNQMPALPGTVSAPLSIQELSVLLVKHYELHEGYYNLMVEFQIGVGAVGPNPSATSPGAMIGVSRVGLQKVDNFGPTSIDAAAVNPLVKTTKRRKKEISI